MTDTEQSQKAGEGSTLIQAGRDLTVTLGPSYADVKTIIAEERERIIEHIWNRAQEMLREAGIQPGPIPMKTTVPLLQYASLEEEGYLQEKWAALLANAASHNAPSNSTPAFVDILRQLTSGEVMFLEALFKKVENTQLADIPLKIPLVPTIVNHIPLGKADEELLRIFVDSRLSKCSFEQLKSIVPADSPAAAAYLDDRNAFSILLADLRRLGLLSAVTATFDATELFYFTALGFAFVSACRKPA